MTSGAFGVSPANDANRGNVMKVHDRSARVPDVGAKIRC